MVSWCFRANRPTEENLKMSSKGRIGWSIRTKIPLILLAFTVLSLLLFATVSYNHMNGLGRFALKTSKSLGDRVLGDSSRALEGQTHDYIVRLASHQAALSNALFDRVEGEVGILSDFATRLWRVPSCHLEGSWPEETEDRISPSSAKPWVLAPGVKPEEVREELARSRPIETLFITLFSNDPNLDSLYLGTETGLFRGYPWMAGLDPSYDHRKRGWYMKALDQEYAVWSDTYVHAVTKELIVTCSRAFFSPLGKAAGVVEADVTLKIMNERITSSHIGKLGYAFLIDNMGKVISRPGLSAGDARWDETYRTENLLEKGNPALRRVVQAMIAGKTGFARCNFEGEDTYIGYAPISSTGWSMGIVIPYKQVMEPVMDAEKRILEETQGAERHIDREMANTLRTLGLYFAAMILVVILVAFRLSSRITRPILALDEGARQVGGGNLDYRVRLRTGDELERLADSFLKMTQDLKIYIRDLKETTAAKERIESELSVAHDIQMGILHKIFPPFPERHEFDIYATLEPAREVGGDLYDFFFLDDDNLCLSVGDVSGKGVPASLFMAITQTLIKSKASRGLMPNTVLSRVNEDLSMDNPSFMFVTLFLGILNIRTGKLIYSNGGHNPPYWIRNSGQVLTLESTQGMALGVVEGFAYQSRELVLQAGESLFLYTDGVTEAMNEKAELFSEQRLEGAIRKLRQKPVREFISGISREVEEFSKGVPQADDMTMIVLKFYGTP
jgi:sigma-B regulation protein RsbU (phosphoserine phosphatase)